MVRRGVSLDEFNSVKRWVVIKAGEKTCTNLHNSLIQGFQLNVATNRLNVTTLVCRASVVYFCELIPINSISV
jgi:hypothetical protein